MSFLIGLIGQNIQGSRSPALHEREADALGLRYIYRLIDLAQLNLTVGDLPNLLTSAERMGFAGLNITYPCKQAVIPLLDSLSEDARAIGAVNSLRFENGKRIGTNTDAQGFSESFLRSLPDAPLQRVVQVGAGGAGAATANAILSIGAGHLMLHDSDRARAQALARRLADRFGAERVSVAEELPAAIAQAQGLIHATPTGMSGHEGMPFPAALLRPDLWVAEIVYVPLETELLRAARAIGCRIVDGGGMAVFQAVAAFEFFTGAKADPERMLRHFEEMMALPGELQ